MNLIISYYKYVYNFNIVITVLITIVIFCSSNVNTQQTQDYINSNDLFVTNSSLLSVTNHDLSQTYTSLEPHVSTDAKNLTREETLEMLMGPRRKTLTFIVIMSSVYSLILLCGIFGNITTCLVIICNSCMHTNTNYYLFSLAVSDFLSLLSGN
jgi:neuromedin U receptor 1